VSYTPKCDVLVLWRSYCQSRQIAKFLFIRLTNAAKTLTNVNRRRRDRRQIDAAAFHTDNICPHALIHLSVDCIDWTTPGARDVTPQINATTMLGDVTWRRHRNITDRANLTHHHHHRHVHPDDRPRRRVLTVIVTGQLQTQSAQWRCLKTSFTLPTKIGYKNATFRRLGDR